MTPLRVGTVAGLVLLVGFAVWSITLQIRLNGQRDQLLEQSQLLSALAAGAKVSHLPGTQAAPQASATLVQAPREKTAFLLVISCAFLLN